ncbi:MAG: hypothetical protein GXO44_02610 [Deferribacteres bacterium]|nr:hypothetical protein [Deferribacteres bacterium]
MYGYGFGWRRGWGGGFGGWRHRRWLPPQTVARGLTYIGPCRCGWGPHAFYMDEAGRVLHASQLFWGSYEDEVEALKEEKRFLEERLKELEERLKKLEEEN